MKRFVVIVLDSFGIGAMEDTKVVRPQDMGANTCKHIIERFPQLKLPNLEKMGLINALGVPAGDLSPAEQATFGRAGLAHYGADTFYGHHEIMGTTPQKPLMMPFANCIDAVYSALDRAGYQVKYKGTKIKFLLVNDCVTVADNIEADLGQIFNVTGALDKIAFSEVLAIGEVVRKVVQVSRVIALGGEQMSVDVLLAAAEEKEGAYIGINCPKSGVYDHGYQVIHLGYGVDPKVQVPTILGQAGINVVLLGKVADIVENPYGRSIPCVDTAQVMEMTIAEFLGQKEGFIATNVQETDLAGHAQDVELYAQKLSVADYYIGKLLNELQGEDVLLVMADHGNDPTIGHSHHTREYVPLLIAGPKVRQGDIGNRGTLSDVGATVLAYFKCTAPQNGVSFLNLIRRGANND